MNCRFLRARILFTIHLKNNLLAPIYVGEKIKIQGNRSPPDLAVLVSTSGIKTLFQLFSSSSFPIEDRYTDKAII
jgi:hypothetical protein